jgi:hypothetical protein
MHTAISRTTCLELRAFEPIFGEYHNYKLDSGEFELQFLTHLKRDSDYLVVFFSSMMVPLPSPYYSRWSWAEHSTASCLYLHDCTSERLCCWYLGDHRGALFNDYANLIGFIATHVGVPEDKLIFIGSSTGGYASLRMSAFFPRCIVHACNPQTILKSYSSWGVEALQSALGRRVEDIVHQDVIDLIDKKTRIHYVQCTEDQLHFLNHYMPFRARLSTHPKVSYELVNDKRGHLFCPSAEDTNKYFESIGIHRIFG